MKTFLQNLAGSTRKLLTCIIFLMSALAWAQNSRAQALLGTYAVAPCDGKGIKMFLTGSVPDDPADGVTFNYILVFNGTDTVSQPPNPQDYSPVNFGIFNTIQLSSTTSLSWSMTHKFLNLSFFWEITRLNEREVWSMTHKLLNLSYHYWF